MLFSFASLLLLHLYPLYATYKALSGRMAGPQGAPYTAGQQQAELETWLMFWSTNAVLYIVSLLFEWSWSWIPFYSEFRFLFVLWLILPQTRGSTYLYLAYVSPFLTSHEGDIDRALSSASQSLKRIGLSYVEAAWEKIKETIWQMNKAEAAQGSSTVPNQAPPSADAPSQSPVGQLFGLVKSYAPQAIAGAGAMLSAGAAASQAQNAFALSGAGAARMAREPEARGITKQSSSASLQQRISREERRRELKRQLEELELQQDSASPSASSTGDGAHQYQNPPQQRAASGGGWLSAFRNPSTAPTGITAGSLRSGSSSGGSSGRPSPDMPNVALGTATGVARAPGAASSSGRGRRAVSSSAAAAASSSGLLGGSYELLDRFSVDIGGSGAKQAKAR